MGKIVVVGSINMDLVAECTRFPKQGETIIGEDFHEFAGGKGANQAVAAARLGADVSLIGSVGKDSYGNKLWSQLQAENINCEAVKQVSAAHTGIAHITMTNKDNAIVVVPGANTWLTPVWVDEHMDMILQADVILLQLEIPLETVAHVLELAHKHGIRTILNPAPYQELSDELLLKVGYLTPNESEFALLKRGSLDGGTMEQQMSEWQAGRSNGLIVTRGSDGVSFMDGNQEGTKVESIDAKDIEVVDTTGAGDTFNGALAMALSEGFELVEAVRFANDAAALSVGEVGAQSGMPTRSELEQFRRERS